MQDLKFFHVKISNSLRLFTERKQKIYININIQTKSRGFFFSTVAGKLGLTSLIMGKITEKGEQLEFGETVGF